MQLEGWDRDEDKFEVARAHCKDFQWENTNSSVTFSRADHLRHLQEGYPVSKYHWHMYEFVLSTLVMHAMPLDVYFHGIEWLLSRDSVALVTCVHAEVDGAERGLDGSEGEESEMRGQQEFKHSVQEVLKVATECGLTIQGTANEVKLSSTTVEGLERSLRGDAEKWVGRQVWFSIVLRRVTDAIF